MVRRSEHDQQFGEYPTVLRRWCQMILISALSLSVFIYFWLLAVANGRYDLLPGYRHAGIDALNRFSRVAKQSAEIKNTGFSSMEALMEHPVISETL